MTEQKDTQDSIATYLITELQMVQQRASQQEQSVATRTNLFIASLSVVTGGIFIAIDKQISGLILALIIVVVLGFFSVLGFITLSQILDSYISSVFLYRRMGRIRRYFVDQAPQIDKYMPFAFGDDRPLFYVKHAPLRGIEAVLLLVNTLTVGLCVSISTWLIMEYFKISNLQWSVMFLGLAVSYTTWVMQVEYIKRILKNTEEKEKAQVRYPSKSLIYGSDELLQDLFKNHKV